MAALSGSIYTAYAIDAMSVFIFIKSSLLYFLRFYPRSKLIVLQIHQGRDTYCGAERISKSSTVPYETDHGASILEAVLRASL